MQHFFPIGKFLHVVIMQNKVQHHTVDGTFPVSKLLNVKNMSCLMMSRVAIVSYENNCMSGLIFLLMRYYILAGGRKLLLMSHLFTINIARSSLVVLTIIYCIQAKDNLHGIVSAVIFCKKGAHSNFG